MPTNILVVDDHRLYRETFCNLLYSSFDQIQVVPAADGPTALNLTISIPFDLIIIDYELATLTGSTVVRRMRDRGKPLPPIVLMSAHPDLAVFARLLHVHGYLGKPVSYEDLQRVVAPLLTNPTRQHNSSLLARSLND